MSVCATYDPDCYGCRLRNKGVSISPAATPSRVANRPPVVRPMQDPSFEKGRVFEDRPGGHKIPVFAPGTLRQMTVRERADIGRTKVDEGLTRLRQDPNVLRPTR